MQPGPLEKGHRRGLESNGQTRCGHTHTDISIRTRTAWEKQNESCLQKHRPCLTWTYFQGDTNLPDGISGCQKHTEGGDRSGSSPPGEEPRVGASACFPTPGVPQEMHFKTMHFTTTSSKGTFLLAALPERNCVTPGRFWGSKPLPISSFPTTCQTHVCSPLQSSPSPLQRPGLSLLFHSGRWLHALGTPPSQKRHVSVCFPAPLY